MIRRMIFLGAASLMCAIPAAAQERGTVEFGAFGSGGMFNKSLTLNSGFGVGGHVARTSGTFFFIWTLFAIGVTALFSAVLSAQGLWSLQWGRSR